MLVPLLEKDFDKYIDFAYELALDPVRSGYPAYFDGIKTKSDFIDRARKAFERPGEEILLYQLDGVVEGWIHYGYLEEDQYLFLNACCIRRNIADALTDLSAYLTARYPGSKWVMGFAAENREAIAWMEDVGFSRLEESSHYVFFFDQYVPMPDVTGVEQITEENFVKFQRVHQTVDAQMYWNCQRVRQDLANWDLFVTEEDDVAGEVMAIDEGDGFYEIFALVCEDGQFHEGLYRRLLACALNEGKRKNERYLTFFVDPDSEENRILPELGFRLVDRYLAYQKRI